MRDHKKRKMSKEAFYRLLNRVPSDHPPQKVSRPKHKKPTNEKLEYYIPNCTSHDIKHMMSIHKPFSITRFGDGELAFIKNNIVVSKVMPKFYNLFTYDEFAQIIINSWNFSDVVGVAFHPIEPHLLHLKKRIVARDFLERKYTTIREPQFICDHRINRDPSFAPRTAAKEWVAPFHKIHIMCDRPDLVKPRVEECWNKECVFTLFPNPGSPEDRVKMLDISMKNSEGCDLVIWGCGLPFKDFGYLIANEHNCVTIDMGSALDGWGNNHARIAMTQYYSYMFD